jgi:hypothetical protein
MTREQIEAIVITSPHVKGRLKQAQRAAGLEDYLFIGGPRMFASEAAARLGCSRRTIERYKAVLRGTP